MIVKISMKKVIILTTLKTIILHNIVLYKTYCIERIKIKIYVNLTCTVLALPRPVDPVG